MKRGPEFPAGGCCMQDRAKPRMAAVMRSAALRLKQHSSAYGTCRHPVRDSPCGGRPGTYPATGDHACNFGPPPSPPRVPRARRARTRRCWLGRNAGRRLAEPVRRPYVALAMAATATTRLGLGTGVTNNVTRHAAVTACSIASIQRLPAAARCWASAAAIRRSHISAVRRPGLAPFERYLRQLQAYLRGESVPFDDIDIPASVAPPMAELELADAPAASRIGWIAEGAPRFRSRSPRAASVSSPSLRVTPTG